MPANVSTYEVKQALRPYLGSAIATQTPIAEEVAHALRAYAPYKESLEGLAKRVSNTIFNSLYGILGPKMTLTMDNGQSRHILMQDLPDLADAALGVLFDGMTVYSVSYQTLKDYSLRTGSLSAMRVLYQKYDEFQSPEEKALVARIIRDNQPRERYITWLKDEA